MTDPGNLSQPPGEFPALILCGGRSRRMGRDKAFLPLGSETVLQRVQKIFSGLSSTNVLVIAHDACPPPANQFDATIHDQNPDFGPLEGLRAGFEYLTDQSIVLVGTCDAPLVVPAVYRLMIDRIQATDADAVVPVMDGQQHPLTAVYRTRVLATISEMVEQGQLRVKDLLQQIKVHEIATDELQQVDPQLLTLRNMNTREEYETMLRELDQDC